MKNAFARFSLSVSKINKTHIQMVLLLVALAMLVIGGGAVEDFGGVGR